MTPKIIPVIHYASDEQAMRNAELAFNAESDGIFLIHMDGDNHLLPEIARKIKARWPSKLIGINFLGMDPISAVEFNISIGLDMTWTDRQLTYSSAVSWDVAEMVRDAMKAAPHHLLFAGVSFKHQPYEPNPEMAAIKAVEFGFIPTTSGSATGIAAEEDKISRIRSAIGSKAPLGIASGITPENVTEYAPFLSHILVATGISSSFFEFDEAKLIALKRGVE